MTGGGGKECADGSEGCALGTVHCFGGSEACGGRETDGGGLARGALVDSSTSVLGALVAAPLPGGAVVTAPIPHTGACPEVWSTD
jgi:hypothetical protein